MLNSNTSVESKCVKKVKQWFSTALLTPNLSHIIVAFKLPRSALENMVWWSQQNYSISKKTGLGSYGHRSEHVPLLYCFWRFCSLKCNKDWSQEMSLAESNTHREKEWLLPRIWTQLSRSCETRLAASVPRIPRAASTEHNHMSSLIPQRPCGLCFYSQDTLIQFDKNQEKHKKHVVCLFF